MKTTVTAWAIVNAKGQLKNWNGDPMYGCAVVRSRKKLVYPDTDRQIKPTDKIVKVSISFTMPKAKNKKVVPTKMRK